MTDKEIMAMRGTEFLYVFEDGDTIKSYVKQIDLERGLMTCWSFSLKTDDEYQLYPKNDDEEKEEAVCVLIAQNKKDIIKRLKIIKTGKFDPKVCEMPDGRFSGCPL